MNSPRLGFYVISIGILLQLFGLAGGSWMGNGDQAGDVVLGGPSYVLLILGMAAIVAGTAIGSLSLSSTLTPKNGDVPRLLPLTPLVFLAAVSIGTGAFAYQASSSGSQVSSGGTGTTAQAPLVAFQPDLTDCPDGYTWHEVMGHCMTPEQIAAYDTVLLQGGTAPVATPVCPAGSTWQQDALACVSLSGAAVPGETAQPSCPDGYFWHPTMVHCMSVAFLDPGAVDCPSGYEWDAQLFYCTPVSVAGPGPSATPPPNATPVCPTGTFWHPVMGHCMPGEDSCPVGWDYNPANGYCSPPPTEPPTATPTPRPGETPTTTPTAPPGVTPTPTPECPAGFFWHPLMVHCMSDTCPEGLVFDPVTLFCVLPTPTATPTEPPADDEPADCPDGFFWHPALRYCVANECPEGLVLDPVTLYCVLPETPTPPPTAIPTTPECPAGYFWHPAMLHCMSNTCPEGLVLNPDTLYCELPGSSGSKSSR